MSDCQIFPKDILDFLYDYSFKDKEEIYTNGQELITLFRVIQALEHYYGYIPNRQKSRMKIFGGGKGRRYSGL